MFVYKSKHFRQVISAVKRRIIAPVSTSGCATRYLSTSSAQEETRLAARPFTDIPGPRVLPLVGTFHPSNSKYYGRFHDMILDRFDQYGPIYRENIFGMEMIFVSDPEAIETIFRLGDNGLPTRMQIVPWQKWRKDNNEELGIFTEVDFDRWRRMRSALDKPLLRPANVATYTPIFSEISSHLVARFKQLRDDTGLVENIDTELFNWAVEEVGAFLYDIRLGGISDDRDPEIQAFITAINNIFKTLEYILYFPDIINKTILKKHNDMHNNAWETAFRTTSRLVNQKLRTIEEKVAAGEKPSGFIVDVLATKQLSMKELFGNIVELFGGAVDTTSNTMQFAIDLLSRNPDVQEKLYQEIASVVGDSAISYTHLQHLPYLRGFLKETFRMYPMMVNNRILKEDAVIMNYRIPAGVLLMTAHINAGRSAEQFPEPEKVRPERWFRENKDTEKLHHFSILPFGYGARSCIGRRIAELEMHILIIKLVQNFQIRGLSKEPLELSTRSLLVPKYPVKALFTDRQ